MAYNQGLGAELMALNGCFARTGARDNRAQYASLFAGCFGSVAGIVHMGQ
ncbi:hypothetical protein GCM10007107_26250 [Shewanella indica]|nr:hypothetical protein GCM10007107_26250 [Shewanella indica]